MTTHWCRFSHYLKTPSTTRGHRKRFSDWSRRTRTAPSSPWPPCWRRRKSRRWTRARRSPWRSSRAFFRRRRKQHWGVRSLGYKTSLLSNNSLWLYFFWPFDNLDVTPVELTPYDCFSISIAGRTWNAGLQRSASPASPRKVFHAMSAAVQPQPHTHGIVFFKTCDCEINAFILAGIRCHCLNRLMKFKVWWKNVFIDTFSSCDNHCPHIRYGFLKR